MAFPPPTIKISTGKFRMSENALVGDWRRSVKQLRKLGVKPSQVPSVTLQHGTKLGCRKPAYNAGYVATVPRWEKVSREAVRMEYRKALARASFDALAAHDLAAYNRLETEFNTTFEDTQIALTRYLMSSEHKGSKFKVMALKQFGVMNPVYRGKVPSEKLGLVEYGSRRTWDEEAVAVMATMQRKGWDQKGRSKAPLEAQAELGKALTEEKHAINDYQKNRKWFGERKKQIRRIRRANAWAHSIREICRKIQILEETFKV